MRILYGVSGEGYGHSSRAKEVISFLEKKGHKVLVATYGQAYDFLKNDFNILKISGINLPYSRGKLKFGKTFRHSLMVVWKNVRNRKNIKKAVKNFRPKVCITDMEPVVSIISKIYNLPLICFDNQHFLTHFKVKVPLKYYKDYLIAKHAVKNYVRNVDVFVILSFAKENLTKKEKVFVVGPLLRSEVINLKSEKGKKIVVYLSKEVPKIFGVLKRFVNEEFLVYGDKLGQDGNLEFRKTSRNFIEELAKCKAVIATAGFSLISEALYLKKPFFAVPLRGQFEQAFNSFLLKEKGFGEYSEKPSLEEIEHFLKNLKKYEETLKKVKFNPRETLEFLDNLLRKYERRH